MLHSKSPPGLPESGYDWLNVDLVIDLPYPAIYASSLLDLPYPAIYASSLLVFL